MTHDDPLPTFDPEEVRAFERARWQRAASVYADTFATATSCFVDALLDAAQVTTATRLLDVACGHGVVAAAATERGATACGVDFSDAMLAEARALHRTIIFAEGDAEALPWPDATFDAVVSNFGIHHVPRPELALAEAFRVLRPGGWVAFSFWAGHTENIAWKLLFDALRHHGDPGASTAPPPGGGFNTAQLCLDALTGAGFGQAEAKLERRTWRHADAASLVAAMRAGTARMAAMIEAQSPDILPSILQDIETNAAPWRCADGLALPIAAVVVSGVR